VVTRLIFHPGFFVYVTGGALFRQRFCGHYMVQTPAEIALKRIWQSIIPEGILPGFAAMHSKHIDKSPLDDLVQSLRNFRTKANVPQQAFRVIYVDWLWSYIEVTHPHDRVRRVEILFEKFQQSLEPLQLVLELLGFRQIALRNVSIDDNNTADFSRNQTSLVFRFIIEAEFYVFDFGFAENRYAIITFLPFEDVFVPGVVKRICRKIGILNLGFLDSEDVQLMFSEPPKHYGQTSTQGIDVKAADFHLSCLRHKLL
jgi:hypothetical protein